MKIALTINSSRNIWSSGASQSLCFVYDILKRLGHECVFISNGPRPPYAMKGHRFIPKDKVLQDKNFKIDVLLMGDLLLDYPAVSEFLSRNPSMKCIYFNLENKLCADTEDILFPSAQQLQSNPASDKLNFMFDEIWVLPHHAYHLNYLQSVFRNDKVKIVPYLWDSHFISVSVTKTQKEKLFYNPANGVLNKVCIFEPNENFIKNCLIPLFICEKAFALGKCTIESINIFNCKKLRKNSAFQNLIQKTSIFAQKKVYFNNRWTSIDALSRWGGAVVAHQTLNELNHLYLECLYLGTPLIHNSPILKDYAYYYDDFNINGGANQLISALLFHAENFNYYKGEAQKCLSHYSMYNPTNLQSYKELLP